MVGGRDYVDSLYNRATQAERQPGSAFKLFVYLSALESGMKPTDTIVDEPITIDGWSPRNSTRTNLGAISLREAFARSINTISAKIGAQWALRPYRHGRPVSASAERSRPFHRWWFGTAYGDRMKRPSPRSPITASQVPYAIRKVVTRPAANSSSMKRTRNECWSRPGRGGDDDLLQRRSSTHRRAAQSAPCCRRRHQRSNKDGWFIVSNGYGRRGMGRDNARRSRAEGRNRAARGFTTSW